jgi:hypothetical protein
LLLVAAFGECSLAALGDTAMVALKQAAVYMGKLKQGLNSRLVKGSTVPEQHYCSGTVSGDVSRFLLQNKNRQSLKH